MVSSLKIISPTQQTPLEEKVEKKEIDDNEHVNSIVAKDLGIGQTTVARARKYAKVIEEKPELAKEKVTTALKKYEKLKCKERQPLSSLDRWITIIELLDGSVKLAKLPQSYQKNSPVLLFKEVQNLRSTFYGN